MANPLGYVIRPDLYRRFLAWLRDGGQVETEAVDTPAVRFVTCLYLDQSETDKNGDRLDGRFRLTKNARPGRGLHRVVLYSTDPDNGVDLDAVVALMIDGERVELRFDAFDRFAVRSELESRGYDVKYANAFFGFNFSFLIDIGKPIDGATAGDVVSTVYPYGLTALQTTLPAGGETVVDDQIPYFRRFVFGLVYGYVMPGRGFIPLVADSEAYRP